MRILLNENFKRLERNYLFTEVARKVALFKSKNPSKRVISLGIGDVSRPISPSVAKEMARASLELATHGGFVGYGDTLGSSALRSAIAKKYRARGIDIDADEIFINDGAKGDLGNVLELLGDNETVICDPVYPVYLDASVISGRKIRLISANEENGFLPTPRELPLSPFVIYLCSPNNPTGAVFSKELLAEWVDFALLSGSLIIFDAAYESYVSERSLPHSVFEIEGARRCAIEISSFSKSAGFTGIRCGWTVISHELEIYSTWKRRQGARFNGASYVSQRGALASFSPKSEKNIKKSVEYYMKNAEKLSSFLEKNKVFFVGGKNAPYLWLKIPQTMTSWQFFDYVLENYGIACTPGVGFGRGGEGYVRLSSFAPKKDVNEAISRLEGAF